MEQAPRIEWCTKDPSAASQKKRPTDGILWTLGFYINEDEAQ